MHQPQIKLIEYHFLAHPANLNLRMNLVAVVDEDLFFMIAKKQQQQQQQQ